MFKQKLFNLKNHILALYFKYINHKTFNYDNHIFKEYIHWYNHTWNNSRRIELPIFFYLFNKYKDKRILEVGNVMNHYKSFEHDVLDKYEKSKNVINEDIICFKPETCYDVVLSCSTLEHVGFDEPVKNKNGFIDAINNIFSNILTPNGTLFFSVPLGYNPSVDHLINNRLIDFYDVTFFKTNNQDFIIGTMKKR